MFNSSTNLSKNAKIIVRFEVLRALSWIFHGNDNAVNPEAFNNETFFDFSSKFQQPWIDFTNSVIFERLLFFVCMLKMEHCGSHDFFLD